MADAVIRFRKDKEKRWTDLEVAADLATLESGPKPRSKPGRKKKEIQDTSFGSHINQYVRTLNGLKNSLPGAMSIMPMMSDLLFDRESRNIIQKHGTEISTTRKFDTYRIPEKSLTGFLNIMREKTHLLEFALFAPRLFLMGIVSTYDGYLANLITAFFRANPGAISSSEKTLTYKEVMELGDFEAAKDHILEKEVEGVIRESHVYHFDWFEKRLGVPLRKDLGSWPKFVEVCERRNLFTHADGRVSRQYLEVCRKNDVELGSVQRGKTLGVSAEYFNEAIDTFFEVGVKLGHVAWRKSIREEVPLADKSISNIAFELIEAERYGLACKILDFAVSMPNLSSDEIRRIMVVNRANAYKLNGEATKCKSILDAEDWSATGNDFKISVAAVRDDVDEVLRMMDIIGAGGSVESHDYSTWPVFRSVRVHDAFKSKYESIFGTPYLVESPVPRLLRKVASESSW